MVGFDEYDRKARLTPGLLLVVPISFVVITLGLKHYPAAAVATGLLGGAGIGYLLAILVRQLGKRIEKDLWQSWGGAPTTVLLRTQTPGANPVLRGTWRRAAETKTGLTLLTADEELADPQLADDTIEAAVKQLLSYGNNADYPLVKKELIQYGFERNFFAVRWIGRVCAIACTAVLLAAMIDSSLRIGGEKISRGAVAAGLAVDLLLLVMWLFAPSESRAELAANQYATQLLQAVTVDVGKTGGTSP